MQQPAHKPRHESDVSTVLGKTLSPLDFSSFFLIPHLSDRKAVENLSRRNVSNIVFDEI